jgi:hypothetical protein
MVVDLRWLLLALLILGVTAGWCLARAPSASEERSEHDGVPQSARYTQRRFEEAMVERRDKTFRCRRETTSQPFHDSEPESGGRRSSRVPVVMDESDELSAEESKVRGSNPASRRD